MTAKGMKRYLWVIGVLAAIALMGWGLHRGEWTTVKHHADTLCTACIGLTADAGG